MIIVEGMDNSGKSTLVAKLAGTLKIMAITSRSRPTSIDDIAQYTAEMTLLSCKYPVVFDRWQPISESIYGPICRCTTLIDDEAKTALDWVTAFVNPLVIYCRPQLETIIGSIHERDQMEGVVENVSRLVQAYDRRMHELSQVMSVIEYDYTRNSYEDLLTHVNTHLNGAIQ